MPKTVLLSLATFQKDSQRVWGYPDIVSLEILLTSQVFISITQVSGSGVKECLGEVRGEFAFPCTLKGLNDS